MSSKKTPLYNSPTDVTRCRASVSDGDRMMSWHQCHSKSKHDGKWCSIHRPGAAEERAAKRGPTQYERECAAREKRQKYAEGLEAEVERLRKALHKAVKLASKVNEAETALHNHCLDAAGEIPKTPDETQ